MVVEFKNPTSIGFRRDTFGQSLRRRIIIAFFTTKLNPASSEYTTPSNDNRIAESAQAVRLGLPDRECYAGRIAPFRYLVGSDTAH